MIMKQIDVKGDVVDNDTAYFYDFFGLPYVSPSAVADVLNDGTQDDVTVNIASNGGDVFAASEIYTMLRDYAGNVAVNIQGIAASAASVIAMAGDKVSISPTAQIMIHKASSGVQGNADDLAHQSEVLNKVDQSIASAYEAKTGMNQGDVLQLMTSETWLTAQDAVNKRFADEIMFVDDKQPPMVNATTKIVPKTAVNKLLNLMNKVNTTKESQPKQIVNTELADKLAILYGNEKENR